MMQPASSSWNLLSDQIQPNPFQQPNTQFGPSIVSQLSNQTSVALPIGSTGPRFNIAPVSYKNLDKPQSNSVSGAPSTNIFGVPRNLGSGFESTTSIFQSNSAHGGGTSSIFGAHGSTSSILGEPSVMSLAPETANNGFGTSVSGHPSKNNTVGCRFPSFSSTSSSVSSSLFGPQISTVSFGTPFQNSSNSASTFLNSSSNNVQGIQNSGSQCKTLPWAIGSTTGKQCKGSSAEPYYATWETSGANDRNSLEKMQSISAMSVYIDKSHEELRMEDYELRNKGPSTVSQLSNQHFVALPFGNTGLVFTTPPVSYKNLDKPQSNSVSGAPSTNIFGVPRNLGSGFESTPSIFQSNSAHGGTSSIFGAHGSTSSILDEPSVMSLAPETANNGIGTSVFGHPSKNNMTGSRFPPFSSTSSSVSSSLFGPQMNSSNSASALINSSSNNVHGIQNSGSQSKTLPWAIDSTTGNQCKGSSVVPYSATRETNGANGWNSLDKMQSISAMPVYSDKSHEELRMEDYELCDKGGNTSRGEQSGFKQFDIKENIFSRPEAFNLTAPNTLSNSQHSVATAATTFSAPTLAKPAKIFSPSSCTFSTQSHSFQPQRTITSSISSFTTAPNWSSSLNPVSQPIPSSNHQLAPFSTTFTSSPFSTISSNKQPFTFSPSTRSTFQPQSTVSSAQSTFLPQSTVTSTTTTTFSPTPNPFSSFHPVTRSMTTDNCLPSISKTFTPSPFHTSPSSESSFTFQTLIQSASEPQSSIISSTPAIAPSINPFCSLNPVNKSLSSNMFQFPRSSAVQTFPLLSTISSSEPIFTFSPSILLALENSLGPFPSFLNASQAGQAVPNVNFSFTTNQNEPSRDVSQVDSQNDNVKQFVSSSTVKEQLSCIQNPFGPQIEVNISSCQPDSRIYIQTGISSLPVSNNPSPVTKAPHLRIRHWSSRQNRDPAQRLNSGSKERKVPFFSDTEDKPCTVAPLMPRMNPRYWVSNSSYVVKNTPLNTHDNGAKGSENKAFATSSSQSEGTSPETTNDISIQEENFDDLLPLLPKLRHGDYYTEPPISLLAENERAQPGFCSHVHDFVVGRRDYGSIMFFGETDVRSLDLESIIQFNKREVIVYVNDLNKPPVGQSLNKPAEVKLLNVKCIDKKTENQYTNGPKVHKYIAMLIKRTKELGADFVSYDPVEGAWKFRVQHF
ncbi:nuclear pore complex protein NUP98B-like isoform X2 [Henckelia pumila]|uniref:nuclear pore complex protein NUP98B-like isoform X2 n=1 Tax=Henckelia pumila TaxID=405737 RepID=UPI003C6E5BCF